AFAAALAIAAWSFDRARAARAEPCSICSVLRTPAADGSCVLLPLPRARPRETLVPESLAASFASPAPAGASGSGAPATERALDGEEGPADGSAPAGAAATAAAPCPCAAGGDPAGTASIAAASAAGTGAALSGAGPAELSVLDAGSWFAAGSAEPAGMLSSLPS